MAAVPPITDELLMGQLGLSKEEAAKVVKSAEKSKGKKLVAMLQSLLVEAAAVSGSAVVPSEGKFLYLAAQKLPESTTQEAKNLLCTYLYSKDPAEVITSKPKFDGAANFLSKAKGAIDKAAFKAAAGVGVVVSEAEIVDLVGAAVAEEVEKIRERGYNYRGPMQGSLRKVAALKFAAPELVTKALEAEFAKILGDKTEKNTHKTAPERAPAAAAAAPADPDAQKRREEAIQRTLLEKVALELELDVGKFVTRFLGDGTGGAKEQTVNPIDVDGGDEAIDYTRLVREFGTELIDDALIARIEKATGKPVHHFLKRGIFFSHRDLTAVLDAYEAGKPFYLYTGRGPSSSSMHLGHLVPFIFTKYLQDAFDCNLVIQMTDDEKFLWKDLDQETLAFQLKENVRDIIALGFNREKTFIFSDFDYVGGQFYRNIVQLQKRMTGNQAMKALGLTTLDSIGKFAFSAVQGAPSFSSSFPHIFGADSNNHCLIPCAIDQDVYFRITRDIAPKLGFNKPAVIHSSFFPAIGGQNTKMSASAGTTIFLTDTAEKVHDVIHKYAFSGAPQTLAEHREKGADLDKDISYQYLRFFMADDSKLKDIGDKYSSGKMLTADVKNELVGVLQKVVQDHKDAKAKVTDDEIAYFMSTDPARFGPK
mmetsp:Transcript_20905/g.54332  ORF Transcript_20905/g.54332 Transcript_20905/m.54332 type:complete len:649 (+) Transcript_20905:266-2212(+)